MKKIPIRKINAFHRELPTSGHFSICTVQEERYYPEDIAVVQSVFYVMVFAANVLALLYFSNESVAE